MNEKNKLTKVLTLDEILDYHKGSVVSKTLIDKEVGVVTLFSFDEGEALSEHTVPFDALVYVFDGKVEITIAHDKFNLEKGQMILMPGNKPHALKALTPFKMMLTMIKA